MKRIHIVGRKNHGKTTLVAEIVRELTRRGLAVGTIKHTGHDHDIDTPGKDSYLHYQAGGAPAAVLTASRAAVFMPLPPQADAYSWLSPLYAHCDLVIVEGDLESSSLKVEVWRAEPGTPSLSLEREDITAVVTDDPLETSVPVWPRGDIALIADRLVALIGEG